MYTNGTDEKVNSVTCTLVLSGILAQISLIVAIPIVMRLGLMILLVMLSLISMGRAVPGNLVKSFGWYGMFSAFVLLSAVYTVNKTDTDYVFIRLASCLLILLCTSPYVKDGKSVSLICSGLIVGGVAGSAANLVTQRDLIGTTAFGVGFYGSQVECSGVVALTIVALLWKCFSQDKKKRAFYGLLIIALYGFLILLGRKRALFIPVFFLVVYVLMDRNRRFSTKLLPIVSAIGALAVVVYLSLNIPIFYDALGFRIDSFFQTLFLSGDSDESLQTRTGMAVIGWQWFFERPLLGFGVHSFAEMYGQYAGWHVYSHNNVVELLVCYGLVGFVLFYRGYYLAFKNLNSLLVKSDDCALFLFSIALVNVVMDYWTISFINPGAMLIVLMGILLSSPASLTDSSIEDPRTRGIKNEC